MIKNGQTFLDIVLLQTGGLEATFEMAMLNSLSITDDLSIGDQLKSKTISNEYISQILRIKEPATALVGNQILEAEGISFWAINKDFKVS